MPVSIERHKLPRPLVSQLYTSMDSLNYGLSCDRKIEKLSFGAGVRLDVDFYCTGLMFSVKQSKCAFACGFLSYYFRANLGFVNAPG
jgi:hypothetical protein